MASMAKENEEKGKKAQPIELSLSLTRMPQIAPEEGDVQCS